MDQPYPIFLKFINAIQLGALDLLSIFKGVSTRESNPEHHGIVLSLGTDVHS